MTYQACIRTHHDHRLLLALSLALVTAIGCGGDDDSGMPQQKPNPEQHSKHPDAGPDGGDMDQNMELADGGAPGGSNATGDGGSDVQNSGSGGNDTAPPPVEPVPEPAIPDGVCARGGLCQALQLAGGNKADLLFAIDNSSSMAEEQIALRAQFPALIAALTSGDIDADGKADVSPATDLHLGVVSSNMGAVGISGIDGCEGFGDDGILQHAPSPDLDCETSFPSFLSFNASTDDAQQTAKNLACIATLGTTGCGFEQPLEAALKALWPTIDPMGMNGVNRITFLGDSSGLGTVGHGDTDNIGFLRNDPATGLSVIAVIVVSDEDDGSSSNTHHLTPAQFLDPSDPLAKVSLDLRNFSFPDELYVLQRYVNGLRALRPGNENLVVFGAIAGVPPDLVDAATIAQAETNDMARETFYDQVLNDPRMQETIDPATADKTTNEKLLPSCVTEIGKAFPPRRLVQVARAYGANGFIQSVCQQNLASAVRTIARHVGERLGSGCLGLKQASSGAACDVTWELPSAADAPDGAPVSCKDLDFASDAGESEVNGGALCKINQAEIQDGKPSGEGWFVENAQEDCPATGQHLTFTKAAKPPTGVRVFIDCD